MFRTGIKSVRAPPKYDRFKATRKAGQASRKALAAGIRRAGDSMARALQIRAGRMPSEYKHVDVNYGGTLNATQYNITLLNGVVQGAAYYQRVGNRVQPTWIQTDISLITSGTTPAPTRVRALVIWDSQPGGTVPTIDEIINDVDSAGSSTQPVFGGRNTNQAMRFRTLMDKWMFLNVPTLTDCSAIVHEIRFLRGMAQAFKGATAGLGDIATGACYCVLYAETTANATITYAVNSRYRFQDP